LSHALNFAQKAISHRRRPFSRLRLRCRNQNIMIDYHFAEGDIDIFHLIVGRKVCAMPIVIFLIGTAAGGGAPPVSRKRRATALFPEVS
jgi:hypothetical protein